MAIETAPRGPQRAITCTHNVAELLEREPGLWPCLTTCVVDVEGLAAVHYAAGAGSRGASALFGPDGVLARWRSVLEGDRETHRERPDERLVTVHGTYGGMPITVLLTVAGAPHEPDHETDADPAPVAE